MTTVGKRLAILAALAALGAAGCGGGGPSDAGNAAGDPDCQSKKDPATGRYLPTPEKCHLGK
jgi:hypothetical protein